MNARTWIAAGLAAAGLALAGGTRAEAAPGRQFHHQSQRIQQGRRHDDLTDSEYRHLRNNERRIWSRYRRDRRDGGGLSWQERQRMEAELRRENRMIYHMRHNHARD